MAISFSLLTENADTTGTGVVNTASVSPAANALIVLAVYCGDFNAPSTPTATGNGLTYVQIGSTQSITGNGSISLFRAMGSSPSAGAIQIDTHGANPACCYWSVVQVTGVDATGTNGSGAVAQSTTGSTNGTGLTLTLAALGSGSASFGAFANRNASATTPGSGYSELSDRSGAGGLASGLETEYKVAGSTTVDCSGITAGTDIGGMAIEIKPLAAPIIDTQPSDATGLEGTTVQFSVSATSSGGSLTYQWQEDNGGGFANVSTGSGGTTATWTSPSLTYAMNGYHYRCNVSDDNGTTATRSALLTVQMTGLVHYLKA